jgi:DNA gyrase inhibitor GyrI
MFGMRPLFIGIARDDSSGRCGQYLIKDATDKLEVAYRARYGKRLPHSGYELDEGPPMVMNTDNQVEGPEGKDKCPVFIPVKE